MRRRKCYCVSQYGHFEAGFYKVTEWALTVRLARHGVICCAQNSQEGGAAAGSGGIAAVSASAWCEHRLPPACEEVHPGTGVVAVALQQGVPVDVLCWIG